MGDELVGPGRERRLCAPAPAQVLQERVALPEHPLVVGQRGRVAGAPLGEELVEEAAAVRRVTADDREVLGCERDDAQHAERLRRTPHRLAIDLRARASGPELQVDRPATVIVRSQRDADHRVGCTLAHERGVPRDAM